MTTTPLSNLGIQSFCFRDWTDNREIVPLLKDIGLSQIGLSGMHAKFADAAAFQQTIDLYRENQIEVASLGVFKLKNDEAVERQLCHAARSVGVPLLAVNLALPAMPKCLEAAEKLAQEFDLRFALHNHGGKHWLGSLEMMEHTLNQCSPRIGLCLDTAWALDAGEDPVKWVKRLGKRLFQVHLKDFIFDRAGTPEDTIIGSGNVDLPKLRQALDEVGFKGSMLLEYEGKDPVPALKQSVKVFLTEASHA